MTVDIELGHFRELEERERGSAIPLGEQVQTAITAARNFPSIKAHMLQTMFTGLDSAGEGKVRFKDVVRVGRNLDLGAALLQHMFRFFAKDRAAHILFPEFCAAFQRLNDLLHGKLLDGLRPPWHVLFCSAASSADRVDRAVRNGGLDLGGGAAAAEELRAKQARLQAYIAAVEEVRAHVREAGGTCDLASRVLGT
eukprot:3438844-Rhodomonas_salina.4